MQRGDTMLECRNLSKVYQKRYVVKNLTFQVKEGEAFALLGSNGAGKTTTIKMILGLVKPTEGEVGKVECGSMGYSPETPYFPPFLNGIEVLDYYAKLQKIERKHRKKETSELLGLVGLEDSDTKIKNYSKGMLQRLAIAQALLGDPKVLILDEPTAGLDAMGRLEIMELIGSLKKRGKTILINSHILNDIERVCDRGIILRKGQIVDNWDKAQDSVGKNLEELFVRAMQVNI